VNAFRRKFSESRIRENLTYGLMRRGWEHRLHRKCYAPAPHSTRVYQERGKKKNLSCLKR